MKNKEKILSGGSNLDIFDSVGYHHLGDNIYTTLNTARIVVRPGFLAAKQSTCIPGDFAFNTTTNKLRFVASRDADNNTTYIDLN